MNIVKNQIDELNLQLTVTVAHDDYAEIEKKELQKCKRTAEFMSISSSLYIRWNYISSSIVTFDGAFSLSIVTE